METDLQKLIGKRFSLINKDNTRIEGTLENLDLENSFIILRNVKNFGTESRNEAKFEPPIPYIIPFVSFHAKDISGIEIVNEKEPEVKTTRVPDQFLKEKLDEIVRNDPSQKRSSSSKISSGEGKQYKSGEGGFKVRGHGGFGRIEWNQDAEGEKKKPFDLQIWLEQFDKKKAFDDLDEKVKSVGPAYDKKTSFFDTLVNQTKTSKPRKAGFGGDKFRQRGGRGGGRGRRGGWRSAPFSSLLGHSPRRPPQPPPEFTEEEGVEEMNRILFTNLFHLNDGRPRQAKERDQPNERGRFGKRGGLVRAYDQTADQRYQGNKYDDGDEKQSNSSGYRGWRGRLRNRDKNYYGQYPPNNRFEYGQRNDRNW